MHSLNIFVYRNLYIMINQNCTINTTQTMFAVVELPPLPWSPRPLPLYFSTPHCCVIPLLLRHRSPVLRLSQAGWLLHHLLSHSLRCATIFFRLGVLILWFLNNLWFLLLLQFLLLWFLLLLLFLHLWFLLLQLLISSIPPLPQFLFLQFLILRLLILRFLLL